MHGRFRNTRSPPVILSAVVDREDVAGLLFERNEQEVLVIPAMLRDVARAPSPVREALEEIHRVDLQRLRDVLELHDIEPPLTGLHARVLRFRPTEARGELALCEPSIVAGRSQNCQERAMLAAA